MSLSTFNKIAASSNGYIKFDELAPGSYAIKYFSILKKAKHGNGPRLLVHLKEGYLILPQRVSEVFAKKDEVNKLNNGRFKFVFLGKDKTKSDRVNFRLEKNEDPVTDVSDDSDDSEENEDAPPNKKPKQN